MVVFVVSYSAKTKLGFRLKSMDRLKTRKRGEVERVYTLLRDLLITAKLPPGEFLSENDLAVRCRTSRTPVREACTRLMQDRWLSRIPQKGFLVTPISNRDIIDMDEYRKVLECFAAEKVAQTATPDQIAELHSIVGREDDPGMQLANLLSTNERFHRRLSELAGNQRVGSQLGLTLAYVTRLASLCTQTVPGFHFAHVDIVTAIEKHQPADARRAMAVHIDTSRDQMIQLFSG
jgi:GntR family transcriptional regulator, rspAB operon transcriptional repressor